MQDKVVFVVCATGGIGSVLAHKLAKSGAILAIATRDSRQLTNKEINIQPEYHIFF